MQFSVWAMGILELSSSLTHKANFQIKIGGCGQSFPLVSMVSYHIFNFLYDTMIDFDRPKIYCVHYYGHLVLHYVYVLRFS